MASCANPGCIRNDSIGTEDEMFMEYMDIDDVWVPVCDKHLNPDNPHVRLTDKTRNMSPDELRARAEE